MNRTPFYDRHQALGARFVDFFGWELPVQFSTISHEHTAVRNGAGIFDVSHMGQFFVEGAEAEAYLQHLTTNNVKKIGVGQGQYSLFLTDQGTVEDDLFVFRVQETQFLVVANASRNTAGTEMPISTTLLTSMNVPSCGTSD